MQKSIQMHTLISMTLCHCGTLSARKPSLFVALNLLPLQPWAEINLLSLSISPGYDTILLETENMN